MNKAKKTTENKMENLKAIEIIAVSKAVGSKDAKVARNEIEAGEYTVDTTVRVTGTVTVGEDYEQQIVGKADAWAIIANLMNKVNGVTLETVVEAATTDGAETKELKARVDKAVAAVKANTVTDCKGKVTTKLNINTLVTV